MAIELAEDDLRPDIPALLARIDAAIKRIVDGACAMRIPADLSDPDLVLADCKRAINALAQMRADVLRSELVGPDQC